MSKISNKLHCWPIFDPFSSFMGQKKIIPPPCPPKKSDTVMHNTTFAPNTMLYLFKSSWDSTHWCHDDTSVNLGPMNTVRDTPIAPYFDLDIHFVLGLPLFFLPDVIPVTTVLISLLLFILHIRSNRENFLFFIWWRSRLFIRVGSLQNNFVFHIVEPFYI